MFAHCLVSGKRYTSSNVRCPRVYTHTHEHTHTDIAHMRIIYAPVCVDRASTSDLLTNVVPCVCVCVSVSRMCVPCGLKTHSTYDQQEQQQQRQPHPRHQSDRGRANKCAYGRRVARHGDLLTQAQVSERYRTHASTFACIFACQADMLCVCVRAF